MECELTDNGAVKTLARALQMMVKIGDDMMLTSGEGCVEMRTLNSTHSTCAKFVFHRPFFQRLALPHDSATQLDAKLSTRTLLPVFRQPGSILSMELRLDLDQLRARVRSRAGLTKTFYVPLQDGRMGITVVDMNTLQRTLCVPAHFMNEVLGNFGRLDEITLAPAPTAVRFQSCVDEQMASGDLARQLRTEMTVNAEEFITCNAGGCETTLTVYFKYLRAVLDFCDYFDCPINLFYLSTGHPLLINLDFQSSGLDLHFDATFIFATRHIEDRQASVAATESTSRYSSQVARRKNKLVVQRSTFSQPPSQPQLSQQHQSNPVSSQLTQPAEPQVEADKPPAMPDAISGQTGEPSPHTPSGPRRRLQTEFDNAMRDDHADAMDDIASHGNSRRRPTSDSGERPMEIDTPQTTSTKRRTQDAERTKTSSAPEESIPETPASQPHPLRATNGDTEVKASDSEDEYVDATPTQSPER